MITNPWAIMIATRFDKPYLKGGHNWGLKKNGKWVMVGEERLAFATREMAETYFKATLPATDWYLEGDEQDPNTWLDGLRNWLAR